jgi:ATP adenylyltransferase
MKWEIDVQEAIQSSPTMQNLWSPWRSHYIQTFSETTTPKVSECFLCDAFLQTERSEELLVVARRKHAFVIMNRYPYNSGHIMIVPNRHVGELRLLSNDELSNLMHTLREAEDVLHRTMKPHGINIGANLGRAAGAGVPDHLHFHCVPRWNGDTNFMPIFADVKVVSEALEETRANIAAAFKTPASVDVSTTDT